MRLLRSAFSLGGNGDTLDFCGVACFFSSRYLRRDSLPAWTAAGPATGERHGLPMLCVSESLDLFLVGCGVDIRSTRLCKALLSVLFKLLKGSAGLQVKLSY